MGNTGSFPGTELGDKLTEWVRRLAADHDGAALIVANTVAALMFEDGAEMWFKLSRICALTEQSPVIVAGILSRLRHRGRLYFKRRSDPHEGVDPEFQFILPRKMPRPFERDRVQRKMEVKKTKARPRKRGRASELHSPVGVKRQRRT
jgi:hypothetical protein